jgi:hypothetical protein
VRLHARHHKEANREESKGGRGRGAADRRTGGTRQTHLNVKMEMRKVKLLTIGLESVSGVDRGTRRRLVVGEPARERTAAYVAFIHAVVCADVDTAIIRAAVVRWAAVMRWAW